jgi:acetoin utilization protein AcuB
MSAPVASLPPDVSLTAALDFIRTRRYRHVPVLSHDQNLLGILSDRDLLRKAADITATASNPAASPPAVLTVRDVMTTPVLTATPQAEIRQIARVLFEQHIGSMPVVSEHGRVVGMITRSDILRTLIKHAPLDLWI